MTKEERKKQFKVITIKKEKEFTSKFAAIHEKLANNSSEFQALFTKA